MSQKVNEWLAAHDIVLAESFAQSLVRLTTAYQTRHGIQCVDDIYKRLGMRKQLIHYWKQHSASTQTKNQFKQGIIKRATKLFCLSDLEAEQLANSAGLSLYGGSFGEYLQRLIRRSGKLQREIYEEALVSERMFYLIKRGRTPAKATLVSLAVALELSIDEMAPLLQKAGYVLSKSIAFDMVLRWLIIRKSRVMEINYLLDELGLPLLMTREKS